MRLIFILLAIFVPEILLAQNFEINIKFIDPDNKIVDGDTCNLTTYNKEVLSGAKRIYTAEIRNKSVVFKDNVDVAQVAMLGLSIGSRYASYKLAIEPKASYNITYNVANRGFEVVSNSESDNLLRIYFKGLDSLSRLKEQRLKLHKELIAAKDTRMADSVLSVVNNFNTDLRNFNKKIAFANPNNIVSPYILTKNNSFDLEEQKIYENFSDAVKKSGYGISLKESMNAALKSDKAEEKTQLINEELIPISGNTITGKATLLNQQYFKKNKSKVTLIEFWASWCAPCRESLQKLYPFYYLNKSKGFDVILVSLDDDAGAWKKASLADNYPWLNISDGKGHSSDTPKNYKINTIPANILINAEGKIIARNIFSLEAIKQILDN
ncbi:TlpA disulfide reductase family protein [Pedobacter sp. KR3-3]|uniref:TlpA disulfide reductase family protein n=1 Tax=Pedobacter albus TaxID=3113905 RepID=A0ABU7I5M1_9SPHI|nr:TlpA disulfide reductase family protein [Pedobacter sp. KR3-3]MEE1944674.1 TlpA disulfide reductase family protein [Pedobacter sp. KR3-3]